MPPGGEKRRVSIAVELLTRPGLLLLDEPTTGLDSTNAARCVEVLSGLAAVGVNTLLSIHQPRPDVLRAMDRLLLLSGDGQVVFAGPTQRIQAHFSGLGYSLPQDTAAAAGGEGANWDGIVLTRLHLGTVRVCKWYGRSLGPDRVLLPAAGIARPYDLVSTQPRTCCQHDGVVIHGYQSGLSWITYRYGLTVNSCSASAGISSTVHQSSGR